MTGRRRLGMPRPAQGYIPVGNREPVHADTQVIVKPEQQPAAQPAWMAAPEFLDFADALAAEAEAYGGDGAPIPSIGSMRASDRQAWFDACLGSEPVFRGVVADLEAGYLLDTSLPVPVRKSAPEAGTKDPVPGSAPLVDEAAAEVPAPASADPGTVITEDGEEPAAVALAEPDCANGGES